MIINNISNFLYSYNELYNLVFTLSFEQNPSHTFE